MKLNLGCGNKQLDGYINLDNDPSVNPDVVADLNVEKLPFDDNTFDEVIASHVLEHIGDGFMNLIKEIYRISKPNSTIQIVVPHYNHWTFHADPTHVRSIDVHMFSLLNKDWCKNDREVNNGSSNYADTLDVDFKIIEFSYRPETGYDHLTHEELVNAMMKYNNVVSETYIKLGVIKLDKT